MIEDSKILKDLASSSSKTLKDIGLTFQIHQISSIWNSFQKENTESQVINVFNTAKFIRFKTYGVFKMLFEESCAIKNKNFLGVVPVPNYCKIPGTKQITFDELAGKFDIDSEILNATPEDEEESNSDVEEYQEVVGDNSDEDAVLYQTSVVVED